MPKTACFFIVVLFSITVKAQQLPLETYTPVNGLVDARINKMFQDSKGRIYFLTREGFSIFDGQRFDNYGNTNNQRTEILNGITEYKNGTVKLFSFDGNTYNIVNNKVTLDSSQKSKLLETNKVFDIANDEKLILTNFHLLKEKDGHFQKLTIDLSSRIYQDIENAIVFKQYFIFSLVSNHDIPKIYLYNYQTQQLCDSISNERIQHITSDKEQNIYFLSRKWQQFNTTALASEKLKIENVFFSSLFPKNFTSFIIHFDRENNAWLASAEKGYCKIDLVNKSIKYFSFEEGILNNADFVFEDIEKNYWFISSGRGVQKLQRSPLTKINTIDNTNLNFVSGIGCNENNEGYINAFNGIFIAGKKINPVGAVDRNSFYWQNQYWTFTDYKTLTGSNGIILHLDKLIEDYTPMDFQTSYTTIDKEGRLLIAGKTVVLITKDHSIIAYKLPYFCDNIIVDEDGTYWCFLRSNFIVRLALQNNIFKLLYSKAVENLNPRYAIKWNDNTFIAGTRLGGIKILTWQNNELKIVRTLDKRNGLSNNFVNVLLKRWDNKLLAATATGLDMISFTASDTIIENLSARNTVFSSFSNLVPVKDSAVLCQTLDGQLFKLENADSLSPGFTPQVFFKNILVNNQPIDLVTQHNFNYGSNNFFFSISAPSFVDNRSMKFRFILSSGKDQWEQHNTTADFTTNNLSPGKYLLTVTVQYPGKFYPDKQLQYEFVVQPPFWKQWWFIAAAALLITGFIFLVVRNYYRRQLEKQKVILEKELAIEQERTRMARELHDGLGSMLSGIKHSFAAMKNNIVLNDKQETIFHSNIDKLNESIKELRNISHSIASESLMTYGLENSLRDYCNSMTQPGALNISFSALNTNKILLTEEQSFHLFRIVQELLNNIIKHSAATNAIVQISYNSNRLYIAVEDNGKGFRLNEEVTNKGMGLKNIESRIKILKGKMDYRTKPGEGTSALMEIPCAQKK